MSELKSDFGCKFLSLTIGQSLVYGSEEEEGRGVKDGQKHEPSFEPSLQSPDQVPCHRLSSICPEGRPWLIGGSSWPCERNLRLERIIMEKVIPRTHFAGQGLSPFQRTFHQRKGQEQWEGDERRPERQQRGRDHLSHISEETSGEFEVPFLESFWYFLAISGHILLCNASRTRSGPYFSRSSWFSGLLGQREEQYESTSPRDNQ